MAIRRDRDIPRIASIWYGGDMKKILVTIVLFAANCSLAFASYDEALKHFQENKFRDALEVIAAELSVEKDMVQNSPNYALRFLAAHCHWKLGNTESAVAHFKRCAEIRRDTVDPHTDHSLMLLELGRSREAEGIATRALAVRKDPMLYYLIGRAAYGVGNFWRAKEFYEKALAADPALYIAYNGLGCALMRLGKFTHANTAFSAALANAPSSPEILNNMGRSLEKMGKHKEAASYYGKALKLRPDNQTIAQNLDRVAEKK